MVDDAYNFGAIAAANALSDIYAKGGTPLAALNVAAFPQDLDVELLREILRGGAEKAAEGGIPIVGGHTVKDREIKFGMAIIGRVRREDFVPIGGARAGQSLVLTKGLGTGILATALKREKLDDSGIADLTSSMLQLNRDGSRIAREHGVAAATDVTGYGLLGHLLNMVCASHVEATIFFSRIPFLPRALDLALEGHVPGGGRSNLSFAAHRTTFAEQLDDTEKLLLADPQTSGGLLLAVDEERSTAMMAALLDAGYRAAIIGRVTAGSIEGGRIIVRR